MPRNVYACCRHTPRVRLRREHDACLELPLGGGETRRLTLVDVSVAGLCFGVDDPVDFLPGRVLAGATVRIGDVVVAGTVVLVHATEEFAAGTLCGARFEVVSEEDRKRLAAAVDGLRASEPES